MRRYGAAEDLADELRQFLSGEPIHARPVGRAERFWRWCRRQPVVAGLSATALVLLLLVAIVASLGYVSTSRAWQRAKTALESESVARRNTEIQKQNAEQARKEAEQAAQTAEAQQKKADEQRRRAEEQQKEAETQRKRQEDQRRQSEQHQQEAEAQRQRAEMASASDIEEEKRKAQQATQKAEEEKRRAKVEQKKAELSQYCSRITLADQKLNSGEVAESDKTLDACPEYFRGWEWHYLKRLCHLDLVTLRSTGPSVLARREAAGIWRWLGGAYM